MCLLISGQDTSGLPAPQAFHPNTLAHSFASRLSPIAFILLFTLSLDNVGILFWLLRGIPAVLFLVCVYVCCL